jgi:hypothetical protein
MGNQPISSKAHFRLIWSLAFLSIATLPCPLQSQSTSQHAAANSGPPAKPKIVPRSQYVGDPACGECHQDRFNTYEKTAHNLTSQLANKSSILGTFAPGTNTMITANPNLTFQMDQKGDEFFQSAIWTSPDDGPPRTRTERLDLVIGSGGKGQTYLYWRDNQLFQLPVGYSTVFHRWIISPGYIDGQADFERAVIPRCLECHATYFDAAVPDPEINIYDTTNFVLGISCERCHGPGRQHVVAYKNPGASHAAGSIVNPAKLSAARQADVCAQCHGGQGDRFLAPAFSYLPGQPLQNYIDLGPLDSTKDVDVHGKQGKLLMKSKCYQMSSGLNCSTCHDVHQQQRDLAAMSQHCLACHKVEPSPTHATIGEPINQNCIDCHMPKLGSKVVYLDIDGQRTRPKFRSHWIKIYSPEELE